MGVEWLGGTIGASIEEGPASPRTSQDALLYEERVEGRRTCIKPEGLVISVVHGSKVLKDFSRVES